MQLQTQVIKSLKKRGLTLSVAESCSGGLLSHRLTNISGASKCFLMSIVAYSNETKTNLLKIPQNIIKTKGAVSRPVAIALARNIKKLSGSHIGIGITGIAGPTGGSKTKPVGLVYIALASKNKNILKRFIFKGSRLQIKQKTVHQALILLKQFLG